MTDTERIVGVRPSTTELATPPSTPSVVAKAESKRPELLIKPRPRYFEAGESITASITGIQPDASVDTTFSIVKKVGEGYAGQVYQVQDNNTGAIYAIKALRPESKTKEQIRNTFFRLCFGGNFSPATNESAVRFGLAWQILLRRGAKVFFGDESVIPTTYGYFWNDKLQTYVEVHEWIEGHTLIPENPLKNKRKREFMDRMVMLTEAMGAYQVSQQYTWWTMLAGANVLEREDESQVAADWRSGIARPFLLPLAPGDLPIIAESIRHGHFAVFDYADTDKLDAFISQHPDDFRDLLPLVEELKQLDTKYRSKIRETTIDDWQREFPLSEEIAERLKKSPVSYRTHLLLEALPFVGSKFHRFLTSEDYQKHLELIARDKTYRDLWFSTLKEHDINTWLHQNRITPAKAKELQEKPWLYVMHKLFFANAPALLQRVTDNHELLDRLNWALTPARLALSKDEQIQWLERRIDEGLSMGLITQCQAEELRKQAPEKRMRSYVVELAAVSPLIELATLPALPLVFHLTNGDMLVTAAVASSPISPSGILRFGYTLARAIADIPIAIREKSLKSPLSRLPGLAIAPITKVGMLFVPAQMTTYYPQMARLISSQMAINLARNIPVYGVPGGALEHYIYQADGKLVRGASKLITIFDRNKHKLNNNTPNA